MTTLVNTLTGYVIKHTEEYLFFRDSSGQNITDDFDLAASYPSKLAACQQCAEYFKRAEMDNDTTWQIVKRREVVIKPKPFEAPFDLHITDPLEAVNMVYDLHCKYSERVASWLRVAGVSSDSIPRPAACRMTITAPKWAGVFSPRERECHYPVVYAMMARDFHIVVAHEVVHSYQRVFCGRSDIGHGADFYGLMKHAALEPVSEHTHPYNTSEAKRLSGKLIDYWKEQGARGLLAALPVEVITKPMKRKGVE